MEPAVLAAEGVGLGGGGEALVFKSSSWRSSPSVKAALDTSKLPFSTGNGRSVTGESKSEIKLCFIFGGLAGGCVVGAEMQSFWADFIHVAACPFPGGWRRGGAGAAGSLGGTKRVHVSACVFVNLYMRASVCAAVRVYVRCACECAQGRAGARGQRLQEEPTLQLSVPSPGFDHRRGRGRKEPSRCVWFWWCWGVGRAGSRLPR